MMNRRQFLQAASLGVGGFYLGTGGFFDLRRARAETISSFSTTAPISQVLGAFQSSTFSGDEHTRPHHLLRDLERYIASRGGRPSDVTSVHDVVIIGGGLSGLISAYRLRDKDWVLLEQARKFGGNTQGEEYQGTRLGLGPAYVTVPAAGSREHVLLSELGVLQNGRVESPEHTRVVYSGLRNLWKGETDPNALESIQRVESALRQIAAGQYPDIPWTPQSDLTWEQTVALDQTSAFQWLTSLGPLHAHVMEYFQLYAWSALGGSLEDLSAAQFLNFVASELDGVLAFPGGNAAITQSLFEQLCLQGDHRMRANTMVLECKNIPGGVEVLIEDESGVLRRLQARAAIMAAPKYVAQSILRSQADSSRLQAWGALTYRAYLVANFLLDTKRVSPAFDLFCLRGQFPPAPSFGRRTDRAMTDAIFADWANHDRSSHSILTVYRPYPLEGARHFLLNPSPRIQAEVIDEVSRLLPQLGLAENSIRGVRMTLWGHALPLAKVGLLSSGVLHQSAAPLGERIFFANQDDFANPSFESCVESAERAAAMVRHLS